MSIKRKEFWHLIAQLPACESINVVTRMALREFPMVFFGLPAAQFEKPMGKNALVACRCLITATMTEGLRNSGPVSDLVHMRFASDFPSLEGAFRAQEAAIYAFLFAGESNRESSLAIRAFTNCLEDLSEGAAEVHSNLLRQDIEQAHSGVSVWQSRLNRGQEEFIWGSQHIPIDAPWSFWRDWYQGFLDGKPLDLDLQREVALIPDADWDKGPEHIAGVIERIRKKYDLEHEIAALKDMLRLSIIDEKPAGRLHNHPPEAIDVEVVLGNEITLVWDQLDQLEEEIAKPDPSPKLLSKIAQVLWDASKRIMIYCGSLADVALKKAAEELGRTGIKWAILIGVGGVAAQSEGVQSVAKAVEEFVKTLLQ